MCQRPHASPHPLGLVPLPKPKAVPGKAIAPIKHGSSASGSNPGQVELS